MTISSRLRSTHATSTSARSSFESASSRLRSKRSKSDSERLADRKEISSSLKSRASKAKQNLKQSLSEFKECWKTTIEKRKTMKKSSLLAAPCVLAYHAVDIVAESASIAICESAEIIIEDTHCPGIIAVAAAVGAVLITYKIASISRNAKLVLKCAILLITKGDVSM